MTQTDDCKQEASALIERYATLLDARRFDEWLALFTEDCTYTALLHEDDVKGTNMVAIGEDKPRLAGRIEVGQGVERDLTLHLLSAIAAAETGETIEASANFAVIRKGAISAWGRYRMELVRDGGELRIRRCTAVLNNDVIVGTIYLPV